MKEPVEMEAGRELDALILERLFGFERSPAGEWMGGVKWTRGGKVYGQTSMPQYSTTWEGMRLVVEKMAGDGWCFDLVSPDRALGAIRGGDFWNATFSSWEPAQATGDAHADTAPLACALAALRAMDGELSGADHASR